MKVKTEPRLSIGELARRTSASARSIRYYEERGLLLSTRSTNGYRYYGEDSVRQVGKIRALLAAGYSTDLIAKLLPCTGERADIELCPQIAADMRRVLERKEHEAAELLHQVETIRGQLGN